MEIKSGLRLSALQLSSITGNVQANIEKVYSLLKRDLAKDTDILILPEVWTVGWACEEFSKSAESIEKSSAIEFLSKISKEFDVNIIGGSFIRKAENGNLYNSCPIIDRNGNILAIYDKNHLYSYCECTEGNYITVGENGVLVEIEGVKIGVTICYDIRFPEIFREYRKQGAQLLVNCAAWGASKPIPWEVLTKARAIENQCFMVALTQSGWADEKTQNIGHSRIIDYLGETITEIKDQNEGIMSCTISFDEMENYRQQCTILKDIKNNYEVKVYEKTADNFINTTDSIICTSGSHKY